MIQTILSLRPLLALIAVVGFLDLSSHPSGCHALVVQKQMLPLVTTFSPLQRGHHLRSFSTDPESSPENGNHNEDDENNQEQSPAVSTQTKRSLEEKMKLWEASEEEIKAASLGGVVPGRTDAFDVGLYIAFPLMVLSGLAFAGFPLIMGNLDVDSVGPPPTM